MNVVFCVTVSLCSFALDTLDTYCRTFLKCAPSLLWKLLVQDVHSNEHKFSNRLSSVSNESERWCQLCLTLTQYTFLRNKRIIHLWKQSAILNSATHPSHATFRTSRSFHWSRWNPKLLLSVNFTERAHVCTEGLCSCWNNFLTLYFHTKTIGSSSLWFLQHRCTLIQRCLNAADILTIYFDIK